MAMFSPPPTLKRRAEFLALARGKKLAKPGFVMQLRRVAEPAPLRIGYTATRKIGNAVARNRARRRLREAARLTFGPLTLGSAGLTGLELVLVCRQNTATVPFQTLCDGLAAALAELRR
jgi:ribonuclease P protein component